MTSLGIAAPASGSLPLLRGSHPAAQISFTRTAWCDLDGDGAIDPRPALEGGDAIMLVPTHDVATTYPRPLSFQLQTAQPVHYPRLFSLQDAPQATIDMAAASYRRYGQQ